MPPSSNTQLTKLPRLTREQKLRARYLLYMEYRPSEIANELRISTDTVYHGLLPAGCPHRRDESGHIWIIGTELADWLAACKKPRQPMPPGMAWCCKCHQVVPLEGHLETIVINRYLERISGRCPHCQSTINRAQARTSNKETNDATI